MRVGVVAGEASGDILGAGLLRALRARCPALDVEGIGGPEMIAAGCRSHYPIERLSVMGLFEVLGQYREIRAARLGIARRLIGDPPDVFVGIDAPDFNIPLALELRDAGIRTVQYVSPQVWAWRRYRIRKIARAVDRMLTLFPFEARFYEQHRVPVSFVGHPLADIIPPSPDRKEARRSLRLAADGEIVALLPGSRMSEVKYLAQPMLDTARWLLQRRAGLRFLLPTVGGNVRRHCEAVLSNSAERLPVSLVDGQSRTVMEAADVVLLASGTATLEATLLKRPMVVTYRMHPLTFRIMKSMWHASYVALPNLLADRSLVPELLQDEAVPARLGPAVLELLENPGRQQALLAEFEAVHMRLRRGADERAADAVIEVAGK